MRYAVPIFPGYLERITAFLNAKPSTAASTLAKHGAQVRKDRKREQWKRVHRELCEAIGKPVPDFWQ